ncbi:MAG: ABC transporter permease, partial [Phycisphaerales bacterium]|nr:ABC transporter permease [Phycisphaerales bacterium]
GLPDYQRLIERIQLLPEAAAATPIVETYGLLRMPYPEGDNKDIATVQVWGVDPASFDAVTDFDDMLYWRPADPVVATRLLPDDPRLTMSPSFLEDGKRLHDGRTDRPGAVLGIHVSVANERKSDGSYRARGGGYWWMPRHEVSLTLVPISGAGKIAEPKEVIFPVVNEFFSGVFQIDKQRVIIPLDDAQRMLRLNEALIVDPSGELDEDGRPKVIGIDPARASKILVRAAPGVTPEMLRDRVAEAYKAFEQELLLDDSAVVKPPAAAWVGILTWEQVLRDLIGPVEKEREMMRILFSIIYLVCAGLVLSIFWAIVHEKTRDIGILRSVGAARTGILWIFLRYGLVIGVVGSIIGLGLAWIVVRNINDIHAAIGHDAPRWSWIGAFVLAAAAQAMLVRSATRSALLPTLLWGFGTCVLGLLGVGLLLHRGTLIWDPAVYYFTVIPNHVDPVAAVTTMIGAVVFSLLGASIPAAKAAEIEPVRALRYE